MEHYSDEDLLPLSGIQHFAYCPRQWALIHVEKQWLENLRTVQGRQLHERVDDPNNFESRGDILITRSVPLASYKLGLYGVADMVEFHAVESGICIEGRKGFWHPVPVEYKRGQPKKDIIDEVQLCAQAICLEEMLSIEIAFGAIFYGEVKRRTRVVFTDKLREAVVKLSQDMHYLFANNITPKPETGDKNCKSCSLVDICLPKLEGKEDSVARYINNYLNRV